MKIFFVFKTILGDGDKCRLPCHDNHKLIQKLLIFTLFYYSCLQSNYMSVKF